jgi:FAD/FMN-containing dehydrogenase/Fe-S oxidoreductase
MRDLENVLKPVGCEARFDPMTRQLYSTDASHYRIEPLGVAFPRNASQAAGVIRAAADADIPVIPRGAGSGLAGGAIGEGLIVEFARFNRQITDFNPDRRTVRVGTGVVLDRLNAFLQPHRLCFGPDVATSSRATLGGMIANNSSGARTPVYGTTADHVTSLEIVLADGRIEQVGIGHSGMESVRHALAQSVLECRDEIIRRMPGGLLKRWHGYGLDRFLRAPELFNILCGSEGTLAAVVSAELRLVPLPASTGLGLIFFASAVEAMQATVELLDLKPAAIEHIDRVLTDQTKGQLPFQVARDLLGLDTDPCESILIVEFHSDVEEKLASLERRALGLRRRILKAPSEMNAVWALRKAGVALLTGCKGAAKPVTCIEDAAVRPERLPEYVAALRSLFQRLGVDACFYGHAAAGLLHVRPVLDLHRAEDLKKFREISGEVSAIVRQFKGSLAGEHGVGIARTEFMHEHLGDQLLGVMRRVKTAFDPGNVFNPGKIFDDGRYRIDTHLRFDTGTPLELPFDPVLAFAAKDESFLANLDQCNGCGGCRKEGPVMCPTFQVTGEEIMSTRGRANVIRAALELRLGGDPLNCPDLESALSDCLSCKACARECPSNVNLPLLKAELLHARHRRDGLPLRERLLGSIDTLGRLGCLAPRITNMLLRSQPMRALLSTAFGFSRKRPLPRFADERFDRWFARRATPRTATRGPVILWDDCFARYNEPGIGKAATRVLEAAGFEVKLPAGRQCCGRPAFSQGNLGEAARLARHNAAILAASTAPVVFLEPSCHSMFADDYRELKLPGAPELARRSFPFETFIGRFLECEPGGLEFDSKPGHVAIHAHCHARAITNVTVMERLARRLPGRTASLLDTGCCGMAGAFGALESKYDLSVKIGGALAEKIRCQPDGATIISSGTSCRQQIGHLTSHRPRHMAELLAESLTCRDA